MTQEETAGPGHVGTDTVESVVRAQLSKALGGKRGMLEAAVTTHDLRTGLVLSVGTALVLLVVRLVQRSTPQFVINSLVGIGIGALFAWRSAQGGGTRPTPRWPTSCPASSPTPGTPS